MANNVRRRKKKRTEKKTKICRFCESRTEYIDFLEADVLRKFQTENGRILPKRITGTCANHQKMLGTAIKRARILSLVL